MLHSHVSNDNFNTDQKRRAPRRRNDVCMVSVDGHPYPVVDWSVFGVLFETDSKPFVPGQNVSMILRFRTQNGIEDIKISGEVVRKNAHTVATQFSDISSATIEKFTKIINENPADIARAG